MNKKLLLLFSLMAFSLSFGQITNVNTYQRYNKLDEITSGDSLRVLVVDSTGLQKWVNKDSISSIPFMDNYLVKDSTNVVTGNFKIASNDVGYSFTNSGLELSALQGQQIGSYLELSPDELNLNSQVDGVGKYNFSLSDYGIQFYNEENNWNFDIDSDGLGIEIESDYNISIQHSGIILKSLDVLGAHQINLNKTGINYTYTGDDDGASWSLKPHEYEESLLNLPITTGTERNIALSVNGTYADDSGNIAIPLSEDSNLVQFITGGTDYSYKLKDVNYTGTEPIMSLGDGAIDLSTSKSDSIYTATGGYSNINGGQNNQASSFYSVVGGGYNNKSLQYQSTVAGGGNNQATNSGSTVSGGQNNQAIAYLSTIGGGGNNQANLDYSTVGGGNGNQANGQGTTVGGGVSNSIYSTLTSDPTNVTGSTISGGDNNKIDNIYSTIGGGRNNQTINQYSSVSGGQSNTAFSSYTFVGGGQSNNTNGDYSTILGGQSNNTSRQYNSILGGYSNNSNGDYSTILGGQNNNTSSFGEVVGGIFSDTNTANSQSTWIAEDRIFSIGNGKSTSERSNAIEILKNGLATLPSVTDSLIDAESSGKAIVTKEWVISQGYGTVESDPIFSASPASSITNGNINIWNNNVATNATTAVTGDTFSGDVDGISNTSIIDITSSATNIPLAIYGSLITTVNSSAGRGMQMFIQSSNGGLYIRGKSSSSWNAWNQMATQSWVTSNYAPTSRNLTAGAGLTGGGNLSSNRTFAIGTPSEVTLSSTNGATGTTHSHAFTPGGTSAQYITGAGTLATFPTVDQIRVYTVDTEMSVNSSSSNIISLATGITTTDWNSTYDWDITWRDASGLHSFRDYQGDEVVKINTTGRLDPSGDFILSFDLSSGSLVTIPVGAKLTLHLSSDPPTYSE